MPRAKRFFLPGYIYHITHRCHDRAFLLKLSYEKQRWLHWVSCAIKRYKLVVLNYCITDNHVHLIVHSRDSRTVIAKSMQLIAGRTGQEYNERKRRSGAFWEDRYHATAVQDKHHLLRCMVYVDLNMVRAKAVYHPTEWPFGGFAELMARTSRNCRLIDRSALLTSIGFDNWDHFVTIYREKIEQVLGCGSLARDKIWTQSIAVGERGYVEEIKKCLRHRAVHRTVENAETKSDIDAFVLRESPAAYGSLSDDRCLFYDNGVYWNCGSAEEFSEKGL